MPRTPARTRPSRRSAESATRETQPRYGRGCTPSCGNICLGILRSRRPVPVGVAGEDLPASADDDPVALIDRAAQRDWIGNWPASPDPRTRRGDASDTSPTTTVPSRSPCRWWNPGSARYGERLSDARRQLCLHPGLPTSRTNGMTTRRDADGYERRAEASTPILTRRSRTAFQAQAGEGRWGNWRHRPRRRPMKRFPGLPGSHRDDAGQLSPLAADRASSLVWWPDPETTDLGGTAISSSLPDRPGAIAQSASRSGCYARKIWPRAQRFAVTADSARYPCNAR